ncbi:hypothetical protein DCAR_0935574 [Daucus carota subsp. sativus]|uniref:FAF domain-containing protein n=1 Tax=Daucus carota subsp. sativus TaxID=79200 RepID=A0AAF1BE37_DAUCS|nr:PREDICTED: protein FANTASTIC FOUR 3-like [Daucus carota subsp. sativus]WOH16025.1 hypothetical protein DCAR_0935574 [Daucus carota subsp. sativus]
MSSTIVYQGSNWQHPENKPLRLKLAAPKPLGLETTNTKENKNPDSGAWNFLQMLSDRPKKIFSTETFCPSHKLSQNSLELCTENLGSETGSDDTCDIDILTRAKSSTITRQQGRVLSAKKMSTRSFPPPLTTISGSNSLHVKPRREGGRLIIEAVEAPSSRACFEAERSNGRLQLRFLKNCEFFYDTKARSEDTENENIENFEREDYKTHEIEDVFVGDEFKKDGANNKIVGYIKKDKDGIRQDVEVVMGRESIARHNSRCKESGHGNNKRGFCNWEAFWVAT